MNEDTPKNKKKPAPKKQKTVTKVAMLRIQTCQFCSEEFCRANLFKNHVLTCNKIPLMERKREDQIRYIKSASAKSREEKMLIGETNIPLDTKRKREVMQNPAAQQVLREHGFIRGIEESYPDYQNLSSGIYKCK